MGGFRNQAKGGFAFIARMLEATSGQKFPLPVPVLGGSQVMTVVDLGLTYVNTGVGLESEFVKTWLGVTSN